jgi:UDP-4-amino-4,6-dideoxy-N-acetyl-beta-L-altrosamine N-acetyltransferase
MHRLRPLAPGDRDKVRAWRNLPEVARWMYTDHEISESEHDRWFDSAIQGERARYWIIVADEVDSGLVSVSEIDHVHRTASWAFYLADPAVRGKGVGAFTEFSVLEMAFGEMGLRKLSCEVLATNPAVIAMHERFGFRREGLFRAQVLKASEPIDVVRLGLLAAEWAASRGEHRAALAERNLIAANP